MSKEFPTINESRESSEDFPLDEHIFERLDKFAEGVQDKKRKKLLESVIASAKRGALECFEESLDHMLGQETKVPHEVVEDPETKEKNASHAIINRFGAIALTLQTSGANPAWVRETPTKLKPSIEKAAFLYASDVLKAYKEALEDKKDPKKFLEERGLAETLSTEYLDENILKKINELPVEIRENLFNPNK